MGRFMDPYEADRQEAYSEGYDAGWEVGAASGRHAVHSIAGRGSQTSSAHKSSPHATHRPPAQNGTNGSSATSAEVPRQSGPGHVTLTA